MMLQAHGIIIVFILIKLIFLPANVSISLHFMKGDDTMEKKCCQGLRIPLSELSQQLEYARTVSSDIYDVYSARTPRITDLLNEYQSVKTKLSMLLDFLFQAKLWCDTMLPSDVTDEIKEEE